jgi:extracellular elastinolytic metalloproteinase
MVREIDARLDAATEEGAVPDDAAAATRGEQLSEAAAAVSEGLPGDHRVEVASLDTETGNAAVVVSSDAEARSGAYVERALRHLQQIGPALGFGATQAPEYVADASDQATSAGAVAVHLRQHYKGIAVYDAAQTVRFAEDGGIAEVAGRAVTVAEDLPVAPVVSPEAALRAAASHVAAGSDDTADVPVDPFGQSMADPGLDLSEFTPVLRTSGADRPDRPTTFDAPPFPHAVTVALMWLPVGGSLRLCWHTKLNVPGGAVWRVMVDATSGEILLATRLTQAVGGRASVVLRAGAAPTEVRMPRELTSYGPPVPTGLPAGFPEDWLLDTSTRGTAVEAVVASSGSTVSGTASGTGSSRTVVFDHAAGTTNALVVNLFALCSTMHDLLYLLGFREADGNFQADNHGRGGRAPDSVLAMVHPGAVWGTANMGTPPDGSRPTMNMGLVTSTNRHTALDPDVVFHEYAHGLSNRLVGGPLNDAALEAVQSRGMGEGWSDFFACVALGKSVVGDWVVNRPVGIRGHRYDDAFPDTYADLGTGRYVGSSPHNLGELWCACLLAASRRVGAWPMAQIVVDALKLTAANPSFLAGRDAVLLAAKQYATARGADPAELAHRLWEVFAAYGMGPAARTGGANVLTGVVADFEVPPAPSVRATVRAEAAPRLAVPDANRAGVSSVLRLPHAGEATSLRVGVVVAHPYVGDLLVSLTSSRGLLVRLHDRRGGGADDLRTTWSSDGNPGLAGLVGQPVGGDWTLAVADHAPRDTGSFESWWLEVGVAEARPVLQGETIAGMTIPDADPKGVTSELALAGTGTASAVMLEVDITHSYIGDLQVTLVGPDGTQARVHDRRGGAGDNLIGTWTSGDGSGPGTKLNAFIGKPAGGTWKLVCVDRAGQDVGKLNRWRLSVTT